MRAYERLLNYVKVYTQSAEGTGKSPSTDCQWDLARQLVEEGFHREVCRLGDGRFVDCRSFALLATEYRCPERSVW